MAAAVAGDVDAAAEAATADCAWSVSSADWRRD